jgi:hypothetical protein
MMIASFTVPAFTGFASGNAQTAKPLPQISKLAQ